MRQRWSRHTSRTVATVCVVALAAVVAGAAPRSASTAAASAFVRGNQIGYPAAASKRAYLIASVDESGATFSVRTAAGKTVYSAPIGSSLGAWSRTYKFVYPLDFGTVTGAETYSIVVTGAATASS